MCFRELWRIYNYDIKPYKFFIINCFMVALLGGATGGMIVVYFLWRMP